MFPILSESPWTSPGSRFQPEKRKDALGRCVDELTRLQFSINLAAQFADSPSQHPVRQQELRARLGVLRRQYSDKIHEMMLIMRLRATTDAKEEIERRPPSKLGLVLPFPVAAESVESIDPCI